MIGVFQSSEIKIEEIVKRNIEESLDVSETVKTIIEDVKARGDAALFDYCEKFDKVKLDSLLVTESEIAKAIDSVDRHFFETLNIARENIIDFHKRQANEGYVVNEKAGIILGQTVLPIEKAGIYVPGGTAGYPSSVLMNAIPALIAGVKDIVMATPCGADGKISDVILTAAKVAGVTKIFKIGGAQAIAALAFGTESVPKVDKITGPGNIYVATAKKMVYGSVDIDMIAGPSEILVIADQSGNPRYIAADMLSQAEHDKMAVAVLITDSEKLAEKVRDEIELQLKDAARESIARESIRKNGKIIIVKDIEEAISICNAIAPEHLEICTKKPFSILYEIKNAGCIFLGNYSPEALGDYFAGTNHILPTSGTARFSSPLSVADFVKRSNFVYYTKENLFDVKDRIAEFAEREGFLAHGKSVNLRFE